jgi:cellobiose phosphorylase
MPPVAVVNWTWYEILALFILDVIGFRPQLDHLEIKPRLLSGLDEIHSQFKIRGARIDLTLRRSKDTNSARVNGKEVTIKDGSLSIPYPARGTTIIDFTIAG